MWIYLRIYIENIHKIYKMYKEADEYGDFYSFAAPLFILQKSKLASLKQLIFSLRYTRKTAESARRLSAFLIFLLSNLNMIYNIKY